MDNKMNIKDSDMEKQYFTPDISDIYVGYELEHCFSFLKEPQDWWQKSTISIENISLIVSFMNTEKGSDYFRVPYLSDEDIESLGFEKIERKTKHIGKSFKKDDIYLNFLSGTLSSENKPNHKISNVWIFSGSSSDDYNFNYYFGECKDINTFRKILKLIRK